MTASFLKIIMIMISQLLYSYTILFKNISLPSICFGLTKLFEIYIRLKTHTKLLSRSLKLFLFETLICIKEQSTSMIVLVVGEIDIYNVKCWISLMKSVIFSLEKKQLSSFFKCQLLFGRNTILFQLSNRFLIQPVDLFLLILSKKV